MEEDRLAMSGKTISGRYGVIMALLLGLLVGLAACGENAGSPTAASGGIKLNTLGPTTKIPANSATATPPANGLAPTVVPFLTPVAPATSGQYTLAFDYEATAPIIEAARVGRAASPDDWQLEISREGVAKLTTNPRDKAKAHSQDYFLSREKLETLLTELNKLAVLEWPDVTPPDKIKPEGLQRHLVLLLKGQPKKITDLSGNTGDNLDKILTLLKETTEQAPLRNSP